MRGVWLWVGAVIVTLAAAAWQRVSGPTWPVRGKVWLADGRKLAYRLPRSAEVGKRAAIAIPALPGWGAVLRYKRTPSREGWQELAMAQEGDKLVGYLPEQPPAGKVAYQLRLFPKAGGAELAIPPQPVVLRFKGQVSPVLLLPHILAMFLGMLFANRAGLGVLFAESSIKRFVLPTLGLLTFGGLVLGPLVQKAAFGVYWSGFPLGRDLTDTKTAVAVLAWVWAFLQSRGGKRWPVLVASLVTLAVFAVPHSLLGSEINWEALEEAK